METIVLKEKVQTIDEPDHCGLTLEIQNGAYQKPYFWY